MKLRMIGIIALIAQLTYAVPPEAPIENPTAPAPVVSMVFVNEGNAIENVFTLASSGDYFGAKNVGLYYPHFLASHGQIKRDAFAFDPLAMVQGINTYPFMFTYKGSFYYLVFATEKLLEEKARGKFPFFATIVKVSDIQEKTNSAQIETVANLFFNQNDTLALGLQADKLEFYNMTQKTKAEFVGAQPAKSPLKLTPKTAPKKKVLLQGVRKPVAAQPVKMPLLKPTRMPVAASPR